MSDIPLVPRNSGKHKRLPPLQYNIESLSQNTNDEDFDPYQETPDSTVSFLSLHQERTTRETLLVIVWQCTKTFIVPVVTIAYLTFCYVVHYRIVPVNVVGADSNSATAWLSNLGAGVTTINIIIISVALYPVASLLSDLRTEEFFRVLNEHRHRNRAVPLYAINGISNPSYGLIDSITVIIKRRCSSYFAMAVLAAGAVWAVSALAPAALGIQPVLADGSIMAFVVGSIPPMSLFEPVAAYQTRPNLDPAPGFSAGVVWAERELNVQFSFAVPNDSLDGYAGYIVPTPNLTSTVNARWLTDTVGLKPYCTWATPVNLTEASSQTAMNETDQNANAVSVYLNGLDLDVSVLNAYFPLYNSNYVTSINVLDPTLSIVNDTTGNLPTDGAMVLTIVQCKGCTGDAINMLAIFVDFTDIPFLTFTAPGAIYEMAFLVCKPNFTIETREVRTTGSMTVQVQPLSGQTYPRQGNLDFSQTALLMSYSLSQLSHDSGPASSEWYGLGSDTQADFLFGSVQMDNIAYGVNYDNTSTTLALLPIEQITPVYTQLVQGVHISICVRDASDELCARTGSEHRTHFRIFDAARHCVHGVVRSTIYPIHLRAFQEG